MSAQETTAKKGVFYGPAETPPPVLLIFSSIQHMLLVLSLGLALPVTIARAAGLSVREAGTFLSISLFTIGVTSILQTIPGKRLGTGYMDLSVSDSAALSACTMAAQMGGMPLVFGMTAISGLLKGVLGSFTYRMRKLFPPEVTGCMIFILGVSIIPTGLKYFLGTAAYEKSGAYDPLHLLVALATLLMMLACTIFFRRLKPYAVLVGIVAGFILSAATGQLNVAGFAELAKTSVVMLPLPQTLHFAFDWRVVIPFLIVTVAAIVDNIGDYSATQRISLPNYQRPNWSSIENGIRASGLGSLLAGLMGGVIQSTATTNIGVAGATGVTSRRVAYIAGGLLIALAFFPRMTGALMLIPEPVLGAVLIFSIAYIMAGGFAALSSVEMDDRRVFVIFISITFAVSTMIPSLWSFLPEATAKIFISPMVMGTLVLLFMTLLMRIGRKKSIRFSTSMAAEAIPELNRQIEAACQEWSTPKVICQKLQIGVDAICEGLFTLGVDSELNVEIIYDELQIRLRLDCAHSLLSGLTMEGDSEAAGVLEISLMMLRNMFDNVHSKIQNGQVFFEIDADL
ncbi:MAG TPA: solute carrier family 23 protein [Syntrophomonas sp.]|nr:solute carrier family 23 protein [Syntrophomonas sp.]